MRFGVLDLVSFELQQKNCRHSPRRLYAELSYASVRNCHGLDSEINTRTEITEVMRLTVLSLIAFDRWGDQQRRALFGCPQRGHSR